MGEKRRPKKHLFVDAEGKPVPRLRDLTKQLIAAERAKKANEAIAPCLPMMTTIQRPEEAGARFERQVRYAIQDAGGELQSHVFVGLNEYRLPWIADVVLTNAQEFPGGLIVEAKWQASNGTADEKFPLLVANIRGASRPGIVVVGGRNAIRPGRGARAEAIAYLARHVDGEQFVGVFTLEQLIAWVPRLHFQRTTLF